MARLLRAGTLLATILLALCVFLVATGLAMGARPEAFAGLGVKEADKAGFVLAMLAGFGAIAIALFKRILHLMLDNLEEENDT